MSDPITSLCWVPRGVCAEVPSLNPELPPNPEVVQAQLSAMRGTGSGSDDSDGEGGDPLGDVGALAPMGTDDWEDDDSELADIRVRDCDHLLLCAKNTELTPELDIYLYDPDYDNVYLHHDCTVSAFPTAVEFLGRAAGQDCSVAAVGTFGPAIELWNLNVLHAVAPDAFLGGCRKVSDNIKYTSAPYPEAALHSYSHRGPVLDLAWNKAQPDGLASASADGTVKLWSTSSMQCVSTFAGLHCAVAKSKRKGGMGPTGSTAVAQPVSTVVWAPNAVGGGFVFISGGQDGTVAITDARLAPEAATVGRVNIAAAVGRSCATESVAVVGGLVLVGADSGDIVGVDLRGMGGGDMSSPPKGQHGASAASAGGAVVWTISNAHSKCEETNSAETVVCTPQGTGGDASTAPLFASGGFDEVVRLWDMRTPTPTPLEKAQVPGVGRIMSMAFAPDDISLVAAAGDGGLDGVGAQWCSEWGDALLCFVVSLYGDSPPSELTSVLVYGQPLVYSIAAAMRPHFPDLFPLEAQGSSAATSSEDRTQQRATAAASAAQRERRAAKREEVLGRKAVESAAHQLATRRIAPRTGRPGGTGDRRRRKQARRAEEEAKGGGRSASRGGGRAGGRGAN